MSFADLGLSEKVLQAVAASGYTEPTPIQAQAIPHVLARRDVLGIAQTGTGKTAAFVLPMLTKLESGRARARMPRTLILEPTRELAAQVQENFDKYGINHKLNVALLIGGVSFGDQDAKIARGVDVLIATPGRLLDHIERGKLLLSGVELLVIDEADRMLDMGFIPDIERIVKMVPFTRQTLFFSATMPPEIQRLADAFLHTPIKVEVARAASTVATITQRLVATGREDFEKRETLRDLINGAKDLQNAIVFCNRKRDVAVLHKSLLKHGFNVAALHGDMDQRSRTQALDAFRSGEVPLLVASDVAARGLDIPKVSHVFNYDIPHHAEDYVHRIGRTGRAGRPGAAFTLVGPGDEKSLTAIEKLTAQAVEWEGPTLAERPPSASSSGSERSTKRRVRTGERSRGGRRGGSAREDSPEHSDVITEAAPEPERAPRRERPARAPRPPREANVDQEARIQGDDDGARAKRPPREPRAPREPRVSREGSPAREASTSREPNPDREIESTREAEPVREARAPRDDRSSSRSSHGRDRQSRSSNDRSGRNDQDSDAPVMGLGEHVPAFLMRPTAPKKPKAE